MHPRNLRLLRIDDQIILAKRIPEGARIPPAIANGTPPKHVEHVENSEIVAINGWETAIAFWSGFDPSMMPDLIVSDVQFKDLSSPLHEHGEDRLLPTGLSHFKPFAAIARATGAPMGIAVHTADPEIWKGKIESSGDPVSQMLGRLAAHEIGELSAILTKTPLDLSDLEPEERVESCWQWLRDNRGANFEKAFPKALSNFRRKLGEVFVPPAEWIRLVNWCRKMSEDPQALIARSSGATGAINSDPGFTYILNDGTLQCISILSLFADTPVERADFDLTKKALPKRCYEMREDKDFFLLDGESLPRIGALIFACSRYHTVYERAKKLLTHFVEIPPPKQLSVIEGGDEYGVDAVALAILFKYVEHQHQLLLSWTSAYEQYTWMQRDDRFVDTPSNSKTLKALVNDVARIFAANRREAFSSAEIKERLPEIEPKAIDRCIDILLSVDSIERLVDGSVKYRGDHAGKVPPPPADFVGELSASTGGTKDLELPPRKFLAVAFGYPDTNYNSLQGRLSKAFGATGRTAGREFFDRFLEGDSPPHVKLLCRQFAQEIGWASESLWPKALQ